MNTYTILIDERQRELFTRALREFLVSAPVTIGLIELQEAKFLVELIANHPDNPLSTTSLNSFVL